MNTYTAGLHLETLHTGAKLKVGDMGGGGHALMWERGLVTVCAATVV